MDDLLMPLMVGFLCGVVFGIGLVNLVRELRRR